jgi:hypothetical protein
LRFESSVAAKSVSVGIHADFELQLLWAISPSLDVGTWAVFLIGSSCKMECGTVEVVSAIECASIIPSFIASDQKVVTVIGSNFYMMNASKAVCSFGGVLTPASVVSSSVLVCEAPAILNPGSSVELSVSCNGADFTSAGRVVFASPIVIISLLPSVVDSVSGGVVTVTGSGFSSAGELMCVVGAGGDSRNSSAVFISNTQVECQVAARPSQNSSFHVVSASMTSNSFVLSFEDPYGLHLNSTVFPTMLHSLGGTVITIASAWSICKDCQVFCDFRGIQVPSARFMSSSRVTCQSSPVSEGSVLLNLL